MKRFHKNIFKKFSALFLFLALTISSFAPYLQTPLNPAPAYAENNQSCLLASSTNVQSPLLAKHAPRVGGVALDMAAKFLANMNDVTGAYYDSTLDRIVFIGKTNTPLPKFDRDDLAVSIKAVIFNNTIPAVSINKIPGTPADHPYRQVVYYGGIEDTRFGKVLFDSDYALKKYVHGYDENQQHITSTVPSYISFFDRFLANNPNPSVIGNSSRVVIRPKLITLKKDDTTSSFVFDQSIMKVDYEIINPNNDPAWNNAGTSFATEMTNNYDAYAQETPVWAQAKQLGKIVSVIKWIKDNGIATDFNFARDYSPKLASTPRQINTLFTPVVNGHQIAGEAQYDTLNTYSPDSGTSSSLKASSQAVPTTKEDIHWTFTNNGTQYDSVAVTADAFRSLGSYNISVVDISFPTAGDLTLAFQRAYSSFSGGQYGVGRGWNIYPATLYDNDPVRAFTCAAGTYPKALAFASQLTGFESFTINDCNVGYIADDGAFNSQMFRNTDGTFTARLTNQTAYNFNSNYKLTTIKDKNGNTITYNYDGSGKLVSIADSKGHQITINYNTFNGQTLISSISDWSGRTVSYTYDNDGNLLTVKDLNNGITTYTYDTNFKLTSVTNRTNQLAVTNTYTDEAKLATQKNAANITNSYIYDKVNRVITLADNQTPSRTQKTKYDTKARILQQTDPLLKNLTYTYGTEFAPLTIKDKNGNTLTYTYDTNGNTTSITYPDTKKVTYQYDTKNRLTKITDERYGLPGKVTIYTYDGAGNLIQANNAGLITGYAYDTTGEILTLTDPLAKKTTWTRDSFGNPLTEVDATNFTTTFTYDAIARLTKQTDPDAKVFSFTYDNNGNMLTQVDAVGTTTNVYDKENRLTKVTLPDNTVSEFAYNSSGTLTSVKDPALNTSTYGYDVYQNLTSQTDALSKITLNNYDSLNRQTQSTTPLGKVSKWTYDANGNILSRIDANNKTTNYQYNAFNRLTKITYPDTKTVTFVYDSRGNRMQMIDPNGTSTYVFDTYDRMTKGTNPYGQSIQYTYDNADNLTQLTYPDGKIVKYTYDNNNRIKTVTDWNNKVITYVYNKNGTVASLAYPNSITTYYTYNNANRVSALEHKSGTTSKAKFVLTRNSVGNITIATQSGSLVQAQTNPYSYDNLGRLTSATLYDPNINTYNYTYDAVGNMTRFTGPGLTDITNTYDADNKLITSDGRNQIYDNNGNLTQRVTNQNHSLKYDFENRLKEYDSKTYEYDGLGNRLFASGPNYRYVTDINGSLSRSLADYDLTFNKFRYYYIYGLGQTPIAQYVNTGASTYVAQYYIADAVGNTRWMTNSSGNTAATLRYDPYGNFEYTQYLPPTFLFSGQKYDEESGLTYMRARYYDPKIQKFISRDPVKGPLSIPQSQNPYSYALNNPINLSDPSGEQVAEIAKQCLLIAGRISGYTVHGLEQAIGRDAGKGVAPKAILDAVRNPLNMVEQAGGVVKYVGDKATVVLNEAGKIITTWATSGEGVRGP